MVLFKSTKIVLKSAHAVWLLQTWTAAMVEEKGPLVIA
jgi:hypothetical protein